MITTDYSKRGMSRYQRSRRLILISLTSLLLLILVFGRSTQPGEVHENLEYLGEILMVVGIGGRLWSILYIDGKKSTKVVDTGPYSVTRNPLYLFSMVAAAGVGAQMGGVVAMIGFALLCAVAFHVVILYEESHLRANLGQAFEDYCARVPRFLPDFRLYREQETVTFRPRVLLNTLADGMVFLVSIPFFELVEQAQNAGLVPVLFRLW
jgi:protein-S-isoprenylcysteine O-methyltransferase Ste14